MRVVIASSEAVPFAKTGGLADVAGYLLEGLTRKGIKARLFMPLYKAVRDNFPDLKYTGVEIKVTVGNKMYSSRLFSYNDSAFFTECDVFFERQELYGSSSGDYRDNAERFIFFSKAVLQAVQALNLIPDVMHSNDWQTGLIPLYMRSIYKKHFSKTATLFTIHNLGYQGLFPYSVMPLTGLSNELFKPEGIEFYGSVNFLKAGILSSTAINTVSENYAQEILTSEYGFGLDGVLRKRRDDLFGILNGIDYSQWNPSKDNLIAKNYGTKDFSEGKALCKRHLLKQCGFKVERPLLGMIGRLSAQKGIDIFLSALEEIIFAGTNVVVLGKGDEAFEKAFEGFARKHRKNLLFWRGYDEALAHRVYAGSDVLLMPSRYEPCGLSQMIAMKYGTVPVARKTGGIKDTVEDYNPLKRKGTGFLFSDYTPNALRECLIRALCVYAEPLRWKRLILGGMKKDFSWDSSIQKYIALYESLRRRLKG
ncbi:MAG: glycogen synthase GlgA [Nitrospirae bacterium]|nr:glycogen synthase GlgA [Nitrospirota bacterium]